MAKSQQKTYACVYSNRWSPGLLLIIFDKRAEFILQSFCDFSSVARRFLSILSHSLGFAPSTHALLNNAAVDQFR